MVANKTVDEYVAGLDDWQAEIVVAVRGIVLGAAPDAVESIKWAQPVYETNGPLAYVRAFKQAVNFGFWRGVALDDPKGLLQGTGAKMRHVKLASLDDVDAEALAAFVRQAVALNLAEGDSARGS